MLCSRREFVFRKEGAEDTGTVAGCVVSKEEVREGFVFGGGGLVDDCYGDGGEGGGVGVLDFLEKMVEGEGVVCSWDEIGGAGVDAARWAGLESLY